MMRDTERMAPARTLTQERRFRDRGQTKIFHGRGAHTRFVGNVLTSVTRLNEPGAAILFQGPPGAGKTTLLAHIAAQTHDAGWRVVYLKPRDLESPARMAQVLGGDYVESTDRHLNTDAVLAKTGVTHRISGTQTVTGAIRDRLPLKTRLLLILDEAQHLLDSSDHASGLEMRDALNDLIDGRTGRRVVLVLGGLSNTWEGLRKRGASRLELACVWNIG